MSHSKLREFTIQEVESRLMRFGISCRNGKGSEKVFEGKKLNTKDFARYRVGCHTKRRLIPKELLSAILRRFEISAEDFINDSLH